MYNRYKILKNQYVGRVLENMFLIYVKRYLYLNFWKITNKM